MNKFLIIFICLTITTQIHAQNNWKVFKAAPIPSMTADFTPTPFEVKKINKEKVIENREQLTGIVENFNIATPNTIPGNFIVSMIQDKKGAVWIGTFGGGVAKFDGFIWKVFNTFNSKLPSDVVYSLAVDNKNNIWIGTVDGLAKFNGIEWEVYNKTNSKLPSNMIYSLAVDAQDNKWIGTTKGLVKLSGSNWKNYNTLNSKIPHNHVTALAISGKVLWIGTFEGLAKFDGANWKVYKKSNSPLPYDDIYSLYTDKSNKIYIGTWGGGLATLLNNDWDVYNSSNSLLPDNYVSSVLIINKNMWIGTLNGLVISDAEKWKVVKSRNSSLPNDLIYSLLNDEYGNTWIGTENGLAVYNNAGFKLLGLNKKNAKDDNSNKMNSAFYSIDNKINLSSYYSHTLEKISFSRHDKKLITGFNISKKGFLNITLENLFNHEIITLKKEMLDAGEHSFEFNLEKTDKNFYLLRFSVGDYWSIKKIHFIE